METLQHLLGWYLGLRVPRPGEGTTWRIDWHLPQPVWMVLLAAIITVIFVIDVYRRDAELLRWRNRSLLIGLRLAVFALVLAMLTELSLTIERTGLPIVAVMVDTSASMSLHDQYEPKTRSSRAADDLLKNADSNRLSIAQHVLTKNDGQFLRQLEQSHQLRIYQFSETATPLAAGDLGDLSDAQRDPQELKQRFQSALKEINDLKAEGDQTRPAPSANKVLADLRGAPPSALVMLTDGVASLSDSDQLSTMAESARRKGVQLHIVGLGSDAAAKDLALYDTFVDEVAFVGDPILFKAKLKSFGFAGKKLSLQLHLEGEKTILARQEIPAPPDGQTIPVELSYTTEVGGEYDYVLEIAEEAEETNYSNNSETRHVSVREEKIRVLLVDGGPRYEFRFLKQLLERDKSIELSTLLQEADVEYTQEDRTAIGTFPIKKEDLARFDVVILGDISPQLIGTSALENVKEYVRDTGGSVIMIAGPQFNPIGFSGTPLESIAPFDLSSARLPGDGAIESVHPALTIEGQKGNSLFRLGSSEAESLQIWNGLPNITWMVEISKLKAGARVFAEHPTKNIPNGKMPIILIQQAGAGKILYHATDESWRWRFRTGDLYYGRYWIQAIRYLSRSRMIGKDRTAELTVDQTVYQRGQPATFRVKFMDEKLMPHEADGVTVTVERKGEGRQTVKLSRLRELATVFEGQLSRLPEGTYHGWVSQPAFNEAPPSVDFRVEVSQRELLRRTMDRPDLQQAAIISHGQFYTLENVDRLPSEIPRGTPVPLETDEPIPLWNRWELFTLVVSLLAAEWMLRKRFKLV